LTVRYRIATVSEMMARPKQFDRDRVVDEALEVFWSRGYTATSLDDLTGAMGLGRGSLYNEFGDKHSLFLAALDRYRAARVATIAGILESTPSARAGIAGVLRGTVKAMFADESRRGCLMVNSIAELASRDPAVAARARDSFKRTAAVLRDALERGKRSGEFSRDLDTRRTARYLANAIYGIRLLAKVSERAVADDVVEVTLKVLD
jgi:TetR/AcrR family transcriptional regulator, transcriptional repressor for nem operon